MAHGFLSLKRKVFHVNKGKAAATIQTTGKEETKNCSRMKNGASPSTLGGTAN